jgi:predicted lipoprotein with Yx(FWY)xxD motif
MKLFRLASIALVLAAGLACGGDEGSKLTLGSMTVSDHGTKDLSGASSATVELDDFYFEPTFLRGTPGQQVKLTIDNKSKNTLHNISVSNLPIDKDIAAKAKIEVDVSFPQSGVLLFICKYHTGQGMNGELLVGNASPQAASFVKAEPTLKVSDSSLGKILTDPSGRTLYTFKNDVPGSGKSAVSGRTAETWPPLVVTSGSSVKPEGLAGDLTLIDRDEGTKQVVYQGQPLYYYSRDTAPGQTNGHGVGSVWFAAIPASASAGSTDTY